MKLKRYVTGKSGATLLVISTVVTLMCVLVLGVIALLHRSPLMVFDIRTEQFSQIAVRPAFSALTVRDASLRGLSDACSAHSAFTGVIEPPEGAVMTYRWRPNAVSVTIAGGPVRLVEDNAVCVDPSSQVSVILDIPQATPDAPFEAIGLVLPIAGPVQVGAELANATPPPTGLPRRIDLMLEGRFTVFGRTIQLWGTPALYPIATDPLPLPAGSRVGALPSNPQDADAWHGMALVTSTGLNVTATADADRVVLFRAGARDGELVYQFGLFAAIAGDPSIGTLALLVFFLVTALQLVSAWMGLWVDDDRAERWRRWQRWRRRS
jgi:hypothetical protein